MDIAGSLINGGFKGHIVEAMMDAIERFKGAKGVNLPMATEDADKLPDWKHYHSLNFIKLDYDPVTPNERAGISPVTVRRMMKGLEDNYYRKLKLGGVV
jgi:hypothetical protein